MVASLLSSIAGGGAAVGAQSPGLSSDGQDNSQPKAAGFGTQHQPPVFRSLSRTLSSTFPPAAVSAAPFAKHTFCRFHTSCMQLYRRFKVSQSGRSPGAQAAVELNL